MWDGVWGDPLGRSEITDIQLDNSDVVTFHCYDKPAGFEARIAELSPMGRPILCTEYLARAPGQYRGRDPASCQAAQRRCDRIGGWSLVRTQTYFLGLLGSPVHDSSEALVFRPAAARWRPSRDSEIQTLSKLTRR